MWDGLAGRKVARLETPHEGNIFSVVCICVYIYLYLLVVYLCIYISVFISCVFVYICIYESVFFVCIPSITPGSTQVWLPGEEARGLVASGAGDRRICLLDTNTSSVLR